MALARRPDVLAREYEVAALGAELSVTRLSAFDGAEVGVDAERDAGDWSAGPAVSTPVPLFDFGQARRSRARAALAEARHNLTQARRQAVEETRRAYASFKASMTNLARVREELTPLLQRRLEQAEAQFKAGQVGATDLLLAQQELRAAQTRLIELRRRNTESLVRLHRAVGGAGVAKTVEEILPASQPSPQPDGERSSP
jgi:outer membrane protein TolC